MRTVCEGVGELVYVIIMIVSYSNTLDQAEGCYFHPHSQISHDSPLVYYDPLPLIDTGTLHRQCVIVSLVVNC